MFMFCLCIVWTNLLHDLHSKHAVCVSQTISEEEQQRIMSEQKMGNFKRGGGGGSPASKKNPKAKVSSPVNHLLDIEELVLK